MPYWKALLFAILTVLPFYAIFLVLLVYLYGIAQEGVTKEGIEFCGCTDRVCVMAYTGGHFSVDTYKEACINSASATDNN